MSFGIEEKRVIKISKQDLSDVKTAARIINEKIVLLVFRQDRCASEDIEK
jgi:hypothetical protein